MKKKIILALLAAVLAVAPLFAFTACDNGNGTQSYYLDNIVCSVTGFDDVEIDVTGDIDSTYSAIIESYGRQVDISKNKIEFIDGSVTSSFGVIKYTLDGNDVIMKDDALAYTFNYVKLNGGAFSIGIQQTLGNTTVTYSLNYYSEEIYSTYFTVTFKSVDGVIATTEKVRYKNTCSKPATPVRDGYTFIDWYSDKDCTNLWYFRDDIITKDTTLYAKWIKNDDPKCYVYQTRDDGKSLIITGSDSAIHLSGVEVPDTINGLPVVEIGGYAFSSCNSATTMVIGNNVRIIGDYAFANNSDTVSVTLPASVTSIGKAAFWYCERLKTIIYKGTKSQWEAVSKGEDWDTGIGGRYTISCTDGNISRP